MLTESPKKSPLPSGLPAVGTRLDSLYPFRAGERGGGVLSTRNTVGAVTAEGRSPHGMKPRHGPEPHTKSDKEIVHHA